MTLPVSSGASGPRIAVVGAGVIGMCVALSLAEQGASVDLFDAGQPGRGASWAAAGMLAPAYEAAAQEGVHARLFELCLASAQAWRRFAPRVQTHTRRTLDYGDDGAMACAVTSEQVAALEVLYAGCRNRETLCEPLSGRQARRLEPSLSENVVSALLLPTDQQVDNWAVIEGVLALLSNAGARLHAGAPVTCLDHETTGVRVNRDAVFDYVVWTAGEGARHQVKVNGRAKSLLPLNALAPVKGQMLAVAPHAGGPRRVLRFGAGYVAPKSTRIVIGATSEWGVDDKEVREDALRNLQAEAGRICPSLDQAKVTLSWAGVRPGTPDHAPMIGWSHVDRVAIATGHYRNGILLAPETGRLVAEMILLGRCDDLLASFSPDRFASVTMV